MHVQQFAEDLAERLLLPLVVGGRLEPLPPIGEARAVVISEMPPNVVGESGPGLERARLAVIRRLCPVDDVMDFDSCEWLIACAVNDLLQATSPFLVGTFGKNRPRRMVEMVEGTLDRVTEPKTLARALMRHSLLSRLLELVRVDTEVSWWVGSETVRGIEPPARLVSWPSLRRVRTEQTKVGLAEMPGEQPWADVWIRALARVVAASPLTDLQSLGRRSPPFSMTGSTLGLLQTHAGRAVAARAIERGRFRGRAPELLRQAAEAVARVDDDAAGVVLRFADQVEERSRQMEELSA